MTRIISLSCIAVLAASLIACSTKPPEDVAPTYWECDLETAAWGPTGNAVFRDGALWTVLITQSAENGILSYEERTNFEASDHAAPVRCDAVLEESDGAPYEITVSCEGNDDFTVTIDGDELTYSREAAVGTIRGTFHRQPLNGT